MTCLKWDVMFLFCIEILQKCLHRDSSPVSMRRVHGQYHIVNALTNIYIYTPKTHSKGISGTLSPDKTSHFMLGFEINNLILYVLSLHAESYPSHMECMSNIRSAQKHRNQWHQMEVPRSCVRSLCCALING